MTEKPMPLLLIEDDIQMCRTFLHLSGHRNDITFVGVTGSSDEGLKLVKDKLPEGIILDLELNRGEGSGLEFLKELNKTSLSFRPIVVVTTRNRSELVHESLHGYGVEWVFCKKQAGYSPEMVINHLLYLRPFLRFVSSNGLPSDLETLETPEELRNRIMLRIDAEMNTIGISPRYKGAPCIKEAIYLLITKDKTDSSTVLYEVADNSRNSYNNVIRNMQSAINNAWARNDAKTLSEHYKAHIHNSSGVPSPTEFVYYYADKIRSTM